MNLGLENKVAFVTGAASGIGAAVARSLLAEGAQVAVVDRDRASGAALAEELGNRAHFVECDVTMSASVKSAVRRVLARFGGIDILVNNAGIQTYGTVSETPESLWDRTFDVNVKGAYLCARHIVPHLRAKEGGVVINLSSVQAFLSQANAAAYTCSKSALLGLTRSIAVDYAPEVRCVAVCPGTVDTPMLRFALLESPDPDAVLQECRQMHLLKRIATPEEVADVVVFLASSKAGFVTGQAIRVDGGLGVTILGSKR